jgi:hypothetical protein
MTRGSGRNSPPRRDGESPDPATGGGAGELVASGAASFGAPTGSSTTSEVAPEGGGCGVATGGAGRSPTGASAAGLASFGFSLPLFFRFLRRLTSPSGPSSTAASLVPSPSSPSGVNPVPLTRGSTVPTWLPDPSSCPPGSASGSVPSVVLPSLGVSCETSGSGATTDAGVGGSRSASPLGRGRIRSMRPSNPGRARAP